MRSITLLLAAAACLFTPTAPALAQTLFIAGDSTASAYSLEQYPRTGWGQVLEYFYADPVRVADLAQSGRSARSYIDEGFFAELEKRIKPGDILLIQFGHNDQKIDSPERFAAADSAYKEYLRQYIEMARGKEATPVLLTSIVRRKFEDGKLIPTHGRYPQAMRDLAAETGVALIDMTYLSGQFVSSLGEEESKAIYLHSTGPDGPVEDNTHFSERGAYAMAAIVARELDSLHIVPLRLSSPAFIRVEQDGSGDFSHIQDAIDSLDGSDAPAIILIGAGVFEEQLFITRDHITLVGAGRDKTIIKTTLLRADWRASHDDDWGAATVNIKASDITFMRLSVLNDYGIVHGDNSHQFAMRLMDGTRIITEDSTFIAGGADTVSLWNKEDGMYYHRRAWFEGYTDFVCPRGWSYITDSEFFSRGGAATIWHDGSLHESQKMVIKNSSFDGVEGFILGRRQYDAQYYLINDRFSDTMADIPIFRVSYDDPSQNRPNLWGDRYYFFGSVKEGQPFAWLEDNISSEVADITPVMTFEGRWDPETKLALTKVQIALDETKTVSQGAETATTLATQHMGRFPDPWLMRKSDGAYAWSYTHGLVLLGMEQLFRQTGNEAYAEYIQAYADHFIDASGSIETLAITEFNIDSILAGRILFFLFERSGDMRYKNAMDSLRLQLEWQPRTHTGGFWHKRKYPWQIWLDGLYMAQPFYARYQKSFGADPAAFDDIVSQFVVIEQKTRDAATGLLYHAWDESALQPWADPETGRSPRFWSRAMGWYAMAIVDTIEQLPEEHAGREQLKDILTRLVDALIPFQDESGLWFQVTDQGAREGNWLEASGSAMFTYAIAKGVRLGMLDRGYLAAARRGYAGLLDRIISTDADGTVHVNDICRSAGLGGTPYRDGTYEYYVSTDRVSDDAHGIGSFLLAASEMMRLDHADQP
jgi:unsaturated rhamnogalacturonyl hydrolase